MSCWKKKKWEHSFWDVWNALALCPSPEVCLAFLLLRLSCPWVDSVEISWAQPSPTVRVHGNVPVSAALVTQAQCALSDSLWGLPVLSPSGTLLPPSAASCTDRDTLQLLWCGWLLRIYSFVIVILINIFYFSSSFSFTEKLSRKYRIPLSLLPTPTPPVSPIVNIFHYCGTCVTLMSQYWYIIIKWNLSFKAHSLQCSFCRLCKCMETQAATAASHRGLSLPWKPLCALPTLPQNS